MGGHMVPFMPERLDLPPALEPWRAPIEASVKPFVSITAEPALDATVFDSKFGGYPYLPPGTPYSMEDGEPMLLLAQIDWSDVPPLPGFPTSGMLQLFIPHRRAWPNGDGDWRALWHEEVGTEAVQDFSFLPNDTELYSDGNVFKLAKAYDCPWRPRDSRGACHRLRFQRHSGPAPYCSQEFELIADTDNAYDFFEQL